MSGDAGAAQTIQTSGAWQIVIKASAAKELASLGNKQDRRSIVQAIAALAQNPRPPGCEKLSGQTDLYRVRTGSFRVVYEIIDLHVVITVIKVGHRKNIYRKL